MKSLFKFIGIGMLTLFLGHGVMAQGNINVLNAGTNLAVVGGSDSVTAIIAQQYIGGRVSFAAGGGAVAISSNNGVTFYGPSNIVVYGYTVTGYQSGGTNNINNLIPHTSGSRQGVFITNLATQQTNSTGIVTNGLYDIGIKLGGYTNGATPDYIVRAGLCKELFFLGGYNGEISARYISGAITNGFYGVNGTLPPGILYSDIGNSPGQ